MALALTFLIFISVLIIHQIKTFIFKLSPEIFKLPLTIAHQKNFVGDFTDYTAISEYFRKKFVEV